MAAQQSEIKIKDKITKEDKGMTITAKNQVEQGRINLKLGAILDCPGGWKPTTHGSENVMNEILNMINLNQVTGMSFDTASLGYTVDTINGICFGTFTQIGGSAIPGSYLDNIVIM